MSATSGGTATALPPFFGPWEPGDRDDWDIGRALIGRHEALKTDLQYVWVLGPDGRKLYMQPLKLEVPGNVNAVYRLDTGQVGFVVVDRGLLPIENVPAWEAARARGEFDLSLLVRVPMIELSRKFARISSEQGAEMETGTAVISSEHVGYFYGNDTFEPQPTAVKLVIARPNDIGRYEKDPWDQIVNGRNVWLSKAEVDEYVRDGRIADSYTLAALAVLDANMPGLRR